MLFKVISTLSRHVVYAELCWKWKFRPCYLKFYWFRSEMFSEMPTKREKNISIYYNIIIQMQLLSRMISRMINWWCNIGFEIISIYIPVHTHRIDVSLSHKHFWCVNRLLCDWTGFVWYLTCLPLLKGRLIPITFVSKVTTMFDNTHY